MFAIPKGPLSGRVRDLLGKVEMRNKGGLASTANLCPPSGVSVARAPSYASQQC